MCRKFLNFDDKVLLLTRRKLQTASGTTRESSECKGRLQQHMAAVRKLESKTQKQNTKARCIMLEANASASNLKLPSLGMCVLEENAVCKCDYFVLTQHCRGHRLKGGPEPSILDDFCLGNVISKYFSKLRFGTS